MAESRKLRMGWWAAAPERSSARYIGWPPSWTARSSWLPGRFRSRRSVRARRVRALGSIQARAYAELRGDDRGGAEAADGGIDFVVITTPNHLHLPVALAALEAGIAVMSDKPATATYDEALALEAAVGRLGCRTASRTPTPAMRWCARRAQCAPSGKAGRFARLRWSIFQGWLSKARLKPPGTSRPRGAPIPRSTVQAAHRRHRHACLSPARVCDRTQVTAINATLRSVVPGRGSTTIAMHSCA
jgi:hypothetical protein